MNENSSGNTVINFYMMGFLSFGGVQAQKLEILLLSTFFQKPHNLLENEKSAIYDVAVS